MKQKVAVKDLQFGMYVFELDRPWTETPFTFQGFTLRTEQQFDVLKKYCEFVSVDQERSDRVLKPRLAAVPAGQPPAGPLPGTRRIVHLENVPVEQELMPAQQSRVEVETKIATVFETVKAGGALDAGTVKMAAARMTESIMRNPDALLLFSSLQKRGGRLFDRAVDCSIYMLVFARFLGMEKADVERAGTVGLLKDVGMLELPESLTGKNGALSSEEIELMRTHVPRGVEKLRRANMPADITDMLAQHHERHDGSGYPNRLKGTEISTIGACAAIVDTFCAMTQQRPYADEMSPSNVLGIMHKWRGGAFNGWLVEEFIRCIGIFPVGSVVELNSGEIGIVISQNVAKRLQPRLMVIKDAKGNPLRPQKLLDLAYPSNTREGGPYRIRRTLEYSRVSVQELFV